MGTMLQLGRRNRFWCSVYSTVIIGNNNASRTLGNSSRSWQLQSCFLLLFCSRVFSTVTKSCSDSNFFLFGVWEGLWLSQGQSFFALFLGNHSILKMGKALNRYFSKDDIQLGHIYMKNSSTSLNLREVQIKTTVKYHLMPFTVTIIKNMNDNKYWQGCGEKETQYLWCCKLVQPFWKKV